MSIRCVLLLFISLILPANTLILDKIVNDIVKIRDRSLSIATDIGPAGGLAKLLRIFENFCDPLTEICSLYFHHNSTTIYEIFSIEGPLIITISGYFQYPVDKGYAFVVYVKTEVGYRFSILTRDQFEIPRKTSWKRRRDANDLVDDLFQVQRDAHKLFFNHRNVSYKFKSDGNQQIMMLSGIKNEEYFVEVINSNTGNGIYFNKAYNTSDSLGYQHHVNNTIRLDTLGSSELDLISEEAETFKKESFRNRHKSDEIEIFIKANLFSGRTSRPKAKVFSLSSLVSDVWNNFITSVTEFSVRLYIKVCALFRK